MLDGFQSAVEAEFARPRRRIDAYIGGQWVSTPSTIASVDPARPDDVVAECAACGPDEVRAAVSSALAVAERWRRTPAIERAAVLFRAAEVLRRRRAELGALEVREAGKPWAEADGDVCEAIDFIEYYGRRMLALDAGGEVDSPPGEENRLLYAVGGSRR